MILIGMVDSPYVRRVAISLSLLGHGFEHRTWWVGRDLFLRAKKLLWPTSAAAPRESERC